MKVLTLALGTLLLLANAAGAAAQSTPAPGDAILNLLPVPANLGDAWEAPSDPALLVPSSAFRDGAFAYYGGPAGARIVVIALLVAQAQPAAARAWDEAGDLFNDYRSDLDYDHDRPFDDLPALAGCAQIRRVEGFEPAYGFPVGVTLCAAAPDLITLVVVSGDLAGATGYLASDSVIESMLSARSDSG